MSMQLDNLAWLLAGESDPEVKKQPEYLAAAEAMDSDSELAIRFGEEKEFATRTDILVPTASLPTDARNRILAVLEKEQRDTAPMNNVIQFPNPRFLAWAAILVAILGGFSFITSEISHRGREAHLASFPLTHEGFREFGATMVRDRAMSFQHRSKDVNQMLSWLNDNQGLGFQAPVSVHDGVGMGCQVVQWHGNKVAIVCVKQGGDTFHLFVTDATGFGKEAPCPTKCEETRGLQNRAWEADGKAFLLMAHDPEQAVPEISI